MTGKGVAVITMIFGLEVTPLIFSIITTSCWGLKNVK